MFSKLVGLSLSVTFINDKLTRLMGYGKKSALNYILQVPGG
jgi:hypothetical protein